MICLSKDAADGPGPHTDFYTRRYRRSCGRGVVEFRCGKSRSSFEKSRLLVSVRGCLGADAPSSSFIVSLSGVVWPSRVEALSRYHARNVWRDTPRSSPTCL